MENNKLLIALAIAACSTTAMADEEVTYSFSVKNWNNKISATTTTGGSITTQAANAPVIGFTARKGDYFVSTSSLLDSSYRSGTVWLGRKDFDVTLGYRYNSNISFIGGYKSLAFRDGSWTNYEEYHKGIYLGVAGFHILGDKTFLYGNYWNAPKMSSSGTSQVDTVNNFKLSNYELGTGYATSNSTQLTLGYRNQVATDYNVTRSRSEKFSLSGIIFGVNVNF